jgi:uncharacterized protein YgbK (DUF1537 family)
VTPDAAGECLLIADDLTGACDAAVHFALRGRRTVACVALECEVPEAAVVAVSTDSRELTADELRHLMNDAARRLPFRNTAILFKKIDSTMRGNVGADIAAGLAAFECDAAIITPAFPAMRRVVEAGYLVVRGTRTFAPIEVARRLRWQGAEPCPHVKPGSVADALRSGVRFVSVDATCDEDLDRIVFEGLASRRRILWAGSGGLAAALARTLSLAGNAATAPAPREGPVLFCLGSEHPVTLAQEEALRAARPEYPILRIPRAGTAPEVIREHVRSASPGALVLSGGDTASLVCRALGVGRIEIYREILPGIPIGTLTGGEYDGWPVATKAGGFGENDALIQVADLLKSPTS